MYVEFYSFIFFSRPSLHIFHSLRLFSSCFLPSKRTNTSFISFSTAYRLLLKHIFFNDRKHHTTRFFISWISIFSMNLDQSLTNGSVPQIYSSLVLKFRCIVVVISPFPRLLTCIWLGIIIFQIRIITASTTNVFLSLSTPTISSFHPIFRAEI